MRRAVLNFAAFAAFAAAAPASAQDSRMERLIRDQADQLRDQQARIEALERSLRALTAAAPISAAALPTVPTTQVAQAEPQVRPRAEQLRQVPAGNAALRPPSEPFTSPSPSGSAATGDEAFDWRKGLPQITSQDGRFAFRLRGRALFDFSSTGGSRFAARNITGTEARSVRLGVEGRAGNHLAYLVEFDFGDNQPAMRSAYLAYTRKWSANEWEFSLGNRLTDRSLDGASSSDSLPLLERSAAALATAPRKGSFGTGAMLKVFAPSWHAAIQIAGNEPSANGSVSDSATLTGRVHWNPFRSPTGIVHLGAWAYREDFSRAVLTLPLSLRLGGRFNDLVTAQARTLSDPGHGTAFGVEAGGTWHSFWAFGEYGERDLALQNGTGAETIAGSISAGYYLTGEKPPYVARTGTWSKPRVLRPIVDGGAGAVEIAARYDDVRYRGVTGATGWSATLGVNWYLLDWVRLSLDGIQWHTDNMTGAYAGQDSGRTLYTRMQVSF